MSDIDEEELFEISVQMGNRIQAAIVAADIPASGEVILGALCFAAHMAVSGTIPPIERSAFKKVALMFFDTFTAARLLEEAEAVRN